MNFGEVENFNLIEQCAERTEKEKQMANVLLSDDDKTVISNWISEQPDLEQAKRLTGLSKGYLSVLKGGKRDKIRRATYEIFKNILEPEPSPSAQAEAEAESEADAQKRTEYEVMAVVDELLVELEDDETRCRVIGYFKSKYFDKESCK
jgi:hypothetical protein